MAISVEVDIRQLRLQIQLARRTLPDVERVTGLQRRPGHPRIVLLRLQADTPHAVVETAVLHVRIHIGAVSALAILQPGAINTQRQYHARSR